MDKVRCLIDAVLRDYEEGAIDKETAQKRLQYIYTLNATQEWGPEREVARLVADALRRIGAKLKYSRFYRKLQEALAYA